MKLLPYENITYYSRLSAEECVERLREHVGPRKEIRIVNFVKRSKGKSYVGLVTDQSFEITRVLKQKNSAQPVIKGVIYEDSQGAVIEVKMRIAISVIVFIVIWMVITASASYSVFNKYLQTEEMGLDLFIPFAMLVSAPIMMLLGFKTESRKSKQFLATVFDAGME